MKKILWLFIMLFLLPTICFAGPNGKNDPVALADLRRNSSNYIVCGAASTGITYYVYKNSIDVQKYAPPHYLIALKLTFYANNGMIGENFSEMARYINTKYMYDYREKKIYAERYYDDGRVYWAYIDPKIIGTLEGYKQGWDKDMAAAEIAFYLAYKMSFYDNPISQSAQEYIRSGK